MRHAFKTATLAALIALCAWGPSAAQAPAALTRVAQVEFPFVDVSLGGGAVMRVRALDVWADGGLAALAAGPLVHLVELDDPALPRAHTLALPDGDEAWDVKVAGTVLYVGLQTSHDGASLATYDVAQPAQPAALGRFTHPNVAGTHNLFVQDALALLATVGTRSPEDGARNPLWLVDVADPAAPRDLGPLRDADGRALATAHDVTVVGARAYVAAWVNGLWIVDFENLDDPARLDYEVVGHHTYAPFLRTVNSPAPGTHNAWPSADGTKLWVTDELVGEGVRVFDISDPANPVLLDFFNLGPRALPHNVVVQDDLAYLSHYLDGLRVLQLVNGEIVEIAARDTVGNHARFNPYRGAWGVFPLENHVLVGDTFGGLLVFEKGPALQTPSAKGV